MVGLAVAARKAQPYRWVTEFAMTASEFGAAAALVSLLLAFANKNEFHSRYVHLLLAVEVQTQLALMLVTLQLVMPFVLHEYSHACQKRSPAMNYY